MLRPVEKSIIHPGKNDKLRTLIVEDNAFFRQSFKERLEALFPVMDIREAALQIGAETYLNKNSFSWEEVQTWVKSIG